MEKKKQEEDDRDQKGDKRDREATKERNEDEWVITNGLRGCVACESA
jgi:hypothetical protein